MSSLAIWSRAKRPADYKWSKPQPVAWILAWALILLYPFCSEIPDMVWWIVAGLALGLLGDIFLLNKKWFVPGFLGFALGHLAYIIGFATMEFQLPFWLVGLLCIPGIVYASLISRLTHSKKMLPFVWIYGVMLTSMLVTALNVFWGLPEANPGRAWLLLGAILFCLSDGFWSWNKFVRPLQNPGLFILTTYYAGQSLIGFGALGIWGLS